MPFVFGLIASLHAVAAFAEPAAEDVGKQLHAEHCTGCHNIAAYTAPGRRVQSYAGLQTQVRACEQNLGLRWFDEDVDAVTAWLNREFYRFPEQTP